MSRGFKKDLPATEAAHFADPRSFISLPKIIAGECTEPKPHLMLFGIDKGPIRAEIFRRNREENDGENRCWKCHRLVDMWLKWPHPLGSAWHHLRHKVGCEIA